MHHASSFNAVTFQQQQQQSQLEQLPSSLVDATRRTKAAVQAELDRLERGEARARRACIPVLPCAGLAYLRTYDTSDIAATLTRRQRHAQLKLMVSATLLFWLFQRDGSLPVTIDGIWDKQTSKQNGRDPLSSLDCYSTAAMYNAHAAFQH
jgi:hypothetical protein